VFTLEGAAFSLTLSLAQASCLLTQSQSHVGQRSIRCGHLGDTRVVTLHTAASRAHDHPQAIAFRSAARPVLGPVTTRNDLKRYRELRLCGLRAVQQQRGGACAHAGRHQWCAPSRLWPPDEQQREVTCSPSTFTKSCKPVLRVSPAVPFLRQHRPSRIGRSAKTQTHRGYAGAAREDAAPPNPNSLSSASL
jgi:hypothetical protein